MNIIGTQTGLPAAHLRLADSTPAPHFGDQASGQAQGQAARPAPAAALPNAARRALVATKVAANPAEDASPQTPASSLPFYRHPADRNAAATAIHAGRTLDLEA